MDDPRDAAWQQILSENGIQFELLASRTGPHGRRGKKRFSWRDLKSFVTDPRVTLVTGAEGQLFYESPEPAGRRR